MATLVLARRKQPKSDGSSLVALKVVHEHLSDDSGMIRLFLDEARVTARVKHSNVVHVEEVGIHAGAYFLVMEYVHGVSLASLLGRLAMERRRLAPKLAVYLAAQAAEALHAAHEATDGRGRPLNVVHRDVSPQNVLLSHLGHVKLIDFGIATSQTGTGVLGKLSYMAPEQITLAEVDRRADVYSLGIVLWETLTGRALFRSQNYDDYRDPAIRTRISAPSRYGSDVPPLLDEVVLRALAPEPDERWDSAAAFRRALLQAVPDAANLVPQQLSAVIHAFAGDELMRLRERLPDDIRNELDMQRDPSEGTADVAISHGLTLEQPDPGASLVPNAPQRHAHARASRPQMGLRLSSHPPAGLASAAPPAARWRPNWRSPWSSVAVGAACLFAGVAIGRSTHRAPAPVAAPSAEVAQDNSGLSAAPGTVRAGEPSGAAEQNAAPPVVAPSGPAAGLETAKPARTALHKPSAPVKSSTAKAKAKPSKRKPRPTATARVPPPAP